MKPLTPMNDVSANADMMIFATQKMMLRRCRNDAMFAKNQRSGIIRRSHHH